MVCTDPPDGGGSSGGGSSGGGSSSGGNSSGGGSSGGGSSSTGGVGDAGRTDAGGVDAGVVGDAGVDAGLIIRSGCANPGPAPRGVGGCCTQANDCVSGLCIQGMCSALCSQESHCAITASATPFAAGTVLTCGNHPTSTGRACLPGTLAACDDVTPCASGESCALALRTGDAGVTADRRCTTNRVMAGSVGDPCNGPNACTTFHPASDSCRQGICRQVCDATGGCDGTLDCVPLKTGQPLLGLCEGAACGSLPTGQDDACGANETCVLTSSPSTPDAPVTRCAPVLPGTRSVGDACTPANARECSGQLCLDNRCTRLCQWDGDCPAALPFCAEGAFVPDAPGVTVAVCSQAPPLDQLCLREADCGLLGCTFLDARSLFSSCGVQGNAMASDPPCGPQRACDPGRLCLPDAAGSLRCAVRGAVGELCTSASQCRSGACLTSDGTAALPGETARCAARCETADDCGSAMACRAVAGPVVETMLMSFPVLHPLCTPLEPPTAPCAQDSDCTGASRGTTCDDPTGACHTPSARTGAACTADHGCDLGLRCSAQMCVRDGCIPNASGNGCQGNETCVITSPITAECRPSCASTAACTGINPALVCQDTNGDQLADACGR